MSDLTREEFEASQAVLRKAIQAHVQEAIDPELIVYDWVVVANLTSVELEQANADRTVVLSVAGDPQYKCLGLLQLGASRILKQQNNY